MPLILGLDHAFQVWQTLEHRFNSVSKTHIHDLKQQLFNITKTTTFDAYFDTIKELSYKLAAAGAPLTNDDLIFHALHGLPPEFDTLQTALSPRIGDLSFEELVTIVNGEELRKNRSVKPIARLPSSSVFLTVNKPGTTYGSSSYTPSFVHQSSSGPTQHISFQQSPQYMTAQPQPTPMYQATFPQQQQNRNWNGNDRSRNNRNQRGSGNNPCQICNKTNHTARTCYHRSNLNYQTPSSFPYTNNYTQRPPIPQAHMIQTPPYLPEHGPSQFTPRLLPTPQIFFQSSTAYPSLYSTNMYPFNPVSSHNSYPPFSPSPYPTSQPPSHWYLDSGATNHVTNDFNNLSLQQSYPASANIMVGNGHTVLVSHSGKGILPTPHPFSLTELLHVPSIHHNLLSVHKLASDNNCRLIFDDSGFVIQDKQTNQILHQGPSHQGLYPIQASSRFPSQALVSTSSTITSSSSASLWHQKL